MNGLTHLDAAGQAHMVDVGNKDVTRRTATAEGQISMARATFDAIMGGTAPKGDVLATARLAGIMAAKRTADLIPLCHPLALENVTVTITADEALPGFTVTATTRLTGKTGVEMEALTSVSVALLTLYDMAKALDRGMVISAVRLTHKAGGKSGEFLAP